MLKLNIYNIKKKIKYFYDQSFSSSDHDYEENKEYYDNMIIYSEHEGIRKKERDI